MRQDPEVIAIGEIRDRATAEIALQAALTGHLILTTFHAGSACEVIGRLLDMGIEPYVVRSGLRRGGPAPGAAALLVLGARTCDADQFLGLPVQIRRLPARLRALPGHRLLAAAPSSRNSCFPNRTTSPAPSWRDRTFVNSSNVAVEAGMIDRWQRACAAVEAGLTSPEEVRRVLGVGSRACEATAAASRLAGRRPD